MARIAGRVMGRVQGVGFRAYVQRAAQSHGLEGEVWNTRDGAVEFEASADDLHDLERFVAELPAGPGRVDGVQVSPVPDGVAGPGFRIGYTR